MFLLETTLTSESCSATLQLDIGLPHKQTSDSSDWRSHLVFNTGALLNVSKTKELITDFRKKGAKTHTPVTSVELRWSK